MMLSFCPYHPDAKIKKYRKESILEKPGNLMIKEILKQWDIKREKYYDWRQKNRLISCKKSNIF